ncbi:hypothetical protein BJ742DRAFT_786211 [Cladochytrium replicatum]|nr:hypothetical protein BJ742DRAFT_786211 [Cladochytrium replicatum]
MSTDPQTPNLASTMSSIAVASLSTNTNTCFGLLPSLSVCGGSLPSKACCAALNDITTAGCFCNPVLDNLLGKSNAPLIRYLLLPICAISNPLDKWIVPCSPFTKKTYNGGTCAKTDVQLDAERVQNAIGFSTLLFAENNVHYNNESSGCFNYVSFSSQSKPFLSANFTSSVPYGVGNFDSFDRTLEYLSLFAGAVTKDMWWLPQVDPAQTGSLKLAANGSSLTFGSLGNSSYFGGSIPYGLTWSEFAVSFKGCETTLSHLWVPDVPTLLDNPLSTKYPMVPGGLLKTLSLYLDFADYGVLNICKFHTKYCAAKYPQYGSEEECVNFISKLPKISPKCGIAGALSGNSTYCRFKHQWMASVNPEIHCPHIGYYHEDCADFNCGPLGDPSAFVTPKSVEDGMRAAAIASNLTVLQTGGPWRYSRVC